MNETIDIDIEINTDSSIDTDIQTSDGEIDTDIEISRVEQTIITI